MDSKITDDQPLYLQIYQETKRLILESVYSPGEKLPPIRKCAADFGVARNTVEQAYRQLVQEGYVASKVGSGYIVEKINVSEILVSAKLNLDFDESLSEEYRQLLGLEAEVLPCRYDFTYGNLEPGWFPAEKWRKLTSEALFSTEAEQAASYTNNQGDYLLRVNIVKYLRKARGVRCYPEQLVIQPGTQAALHNLLLLLDASKDCIAMEEPGYSGARNVFESAGFDLCACPVAGSEARFLQTVGTSRAKLAYVTPSNQFPTGAIMPLYMRQSLISWAEKNDSYVLEDDYCCEFRHRGKPTPSLQSLDTYDRVIYMGTFSKSLSPALRINYLILPPKLLRRWQTLFADYHSSVPWLSQVVLRRFIEQGHWEKLVRRAQTKNRRKRDLLMDSIKKYMGDHVSITEGGAGLHILVSVNDGRDQKTLIEEARRGNVKVYDTDRYWMADDHPMYNCVLIGFSAIVEQDIEPGIEALTKAWFHDGDQAATQK